MHLTLHQIDRFFRFLPQIKALFFYFNRFFVKYFLSSLRACHWLIISDYFSSTFPMLNSHIRKMDFVLRRCHQIVFDWTRAFCICYDLSNENNLVAKVCLQKKFLTFWDGDKCNFFFRFPHIAVAFPRCECIFPILKPNKSNPTDNSKYLYIIITNFFVWFWFIKTNI